MPSLYETAIPVYIRNLRILSALLAKGTSHVGPEKESTLFVAPPPCILQRHFLHLHTAYPVSGAGCILHNSFQQQSQPILSNYNHHHQKRKEST
jgi:hypothetical protein